jgi:hypothetical protein
MLAERGRSQEVENKAFGIELIRPIYPGNRLQAYLDEMMPSVPKY